MATNLPRASAGFRSLVLPLVLLALTSCAPSIDMVRLSSQQYPPKKSASNVETLSEMPDRPFVKIAQMTIANSKKSAASLQVMIRQKAAEMGADAVVFSDPEISFTGGTHYAPVYRPWGYYSPYYGYYGGSYVTARPLPYKVRRNTLSGLAIRYR